MGNIQEGNEKGTFRAVNSEALRFEISKAGWAIWQDTFLLSASCFSHFSITWGSPTAQQRATVIPMLSPIHRLTAWMQPRTWILSCRLSRWYTQKRQLEPSFQEWSPKPGDWRKTMSRGSVVFDYRQLSPQNQPEENAETLREMNAFIETLSKKVSLLKKCCSIFN